jgi:hypothetical protein
MCGANYPKAVLASQMGVTVAKGIPPPKQKNACGSLFTALGAECLGRKRPYSGTLSVKPPVTDSDFVQITIATRKSHTSHKKLHADHGGIGVSVVFLLDWLYSLPKQTNRQTNNIIITIDVLVIIQETS